MCIIGVKLPIRGMGIPFYQWIILNVRTTQTIERYAELGRVPLMYIRTARIINAGYEIMLL
jgi:hypothetical protein